MNKPFSHKNFERKESTTNQSIIALSILLTFLCCAPKVNAQKEETKTKINQVINKSFFDELKSTIKTYSPAEEQFFKEAIDSLQQDEYIRENIRAFLQGTVDKLPNEEQKNLGRLAAINLTYPDTTGNIYYLERNNINVDIGTAVEIENFYDIYTNRFIKYRKYLLGRQRIEAEKKLPWLPEFVKKNPENVRKPHIEKVNIQQKNYLNLAKEMIAKDFPKEQPILGKAIQYIEEDSYIKTNINCFLSETIGKLPEQDREKALLEAISIITKGTEKATFIQRNNLRLNKRSQEEIDAFLEIYTTWAETYVVYARKTRVF